MAFSNLIINLPHTQKQPIFEFSVDSYYVLASGPNGIEIPELTLKPKKFNSNSKLTYTIQSKLNKFFDVDENGVFKILTNNLDESMSMYQNGTFLIPILVKDKYENSQLIHVILQLSKNLKQKQCPKISNNAICRFSINLESFDASRSHF